MGSSYSVEVSDYERDDGIHCHDCLCLPCGGCHWVLLGLATYNDAKSARRNNDPVMWGACWWAFWAGFPASSICACQ